MFEQEVTVKNKTGLHARPASDFVKLANSFKSSIMIHFKEKKLNGKSMLNVLGAGISCGSQIKLTAEGADEADAIAALVDLIENKLTE